MRKNGKKQEAAELKEQKKKEREEMKQKRQEEQRRKAEERAKKAEQRAREKAQREEEKAHKAEEKAQKARSKGKQPINAGVKRTHDSGRCTRSKTQPQPKIPRINMDCDESECCLCFVTYEEDQSGKDWVGVRVEDGCMKIVLMIVFLMIMGWSDYALYASRYNHS